ncbi:hypothetical protein [Burkholderia ubonensis]|uniref:hypothetical protein n=1 Tax=Burkholderia ubonensis TaxID=101571 RepID=UPI00075A8FD6|nr:hypothetical protein [Burkholderia ubonensis]AOI69747.1 hypothetical protein WI31_09300 [Burkholderia ubonensis]KUZ15606.1 hypothetical protein WI29_21050 [Burkholderia ubonensis]KUZ25369.1 hypothetical protein WI30_28735 [Burkholderia ubonensis]KUZ32186.1 hypothetical protein WI32_22800 [Burkholderia ubonensis]KUZ52292.1 hypothetical protein WI34_29845 [Burkholderia ubonensis]
MSIRLANADLVLILSLALGGALLLTLRFRPKTWLGIVFEAIVANAAAVAAVLAFDALFA